MVNHYYFYGVDTDFGPFFVKFCSYFPYTAKLCLNGHDYSSMLDRSLSGRAFFEDVIRQNLDLGRPDQVARIFDRRVSRRTPSRFRTRVITQGVTPSLHVHSTESSRLRPGGLPHELGFSVTDFVAQAGLG